MNFITRDDIEKDDPVYKLIRKIRHLRLDLIQMNFFNIKIHQIKPDSMIQNLENKTIEQLNDFYQNLEWCLRNGYVNLIYNIVNRQSDYNFDQIKVLLKDKNLEQIKDIAYEMLIKHNINFEDDDSVNYFNTETSIDELEKNYFTKIEKKIHQTNQKHNEDIDEDIRTTCSLM